MTPPLVPAAEYLRMSTEHQQFSIKNQKAAIREYARKNGFAVIKSYSDEARSGLSLNRRAGLKQLLHDAVAQPTFEAILVYDVSRWGRFQDVDEAAHYEFLCKSVGIPIHYCAEEFTTEASLAGSILKSVKRVMAAEYSRELGVKVYRGQRRLAEMGYKMGGAASYGLRRMLISSEGTPKQLLAPGEYKSLHSDRVVLVPGPAEEVAIVREIFDMAANRGMRAEAIAKQLNMRELRFSDSRPDWERQNVANMLHNPAYAGCNTWGRSYQRLHGRVRVISRESWVLKKNAFPPIVSIQTFEAANKALVWKRTDEELLEGLKRVWQVRGSVTQEILLATEGAPSYATVCWHFGTLENALSKIGYRHQRNYELARQRGIRFQKMHRELVMRIWRLFSRHLEILSASSSPRRVLRLDGQIKISVQFATTRRISLHRYGWRVQVPYRERDNVTLLCYLDLRNEGVVSKYFVPGFSHQIQRNFTVNPDDPEIPHTKLHTLSDFCKIARKVASTKRT